MNQVLDQINIDVLLHKSISGERNEPSLIIPHYILNRLETGEAQHCLPFHSTNINRVRPT